MRAYYYSKLKCSTSKSILNFDFLTGYRTFWVFLYGVVDEFGNSTVWDDLFLNASEALLAVKKNILQEGISSLIGPEDGKNDSENWN